MTMIDDPQSERAPLRGSTARQLAAPTVVRTDRYNARWNLAGNLIHLLLGSAQTGGSFTLIEVVERQAPPRHIHHREDELIYVLEGELTVEIDGRVFPAPAGTAALIPRGCVHGFAVETGPARLLVLFAPASAEGLFLDTSEPAPSLDLPPIPAGADDPARMAQIAAPMLAPYGFEVVGPPVAPRQGVDRHDRLHGA
jgi:quercetin dioxygenase-like cupin family protein